MPISSGLRCLALPALVCLCASSHASLIVYFSQESFLAATSAQGTDTFTGIIPATEYPSPLTRSAGTYAYIATASAGSFSGAGTPANSWLSTFTPTATMTFNGFANAAQAIGGNFFGSDAIGQFKNGSVTVTARDSSGTLTQTIANATETSFLGFVSSDSLISLSVTAVQVGQDSIWPTLDNLVIAQRPSSNGVPEPHSTTLLLAGIGIMGWLARRRRA